MTYRLKNKHKHKLVNERTFEIEILTGQVNYDNLFCEFKNENSSKVLKII